MTLGERIAYYRKKAGYSQEGLAERLGVSRQAISKWETGEATPDAERIIALAAALGISTDTLLLGKEEAGTPLTRKRKRYGSPPPPRNGWIICPGISGGCSGRKAILPGILWRRRGWGSCWWGCWARFGFGSILSMQNSAWGMQGFWDNMSGMGGMSAAFRFPIIFADILCILGGIVIIGGVALAIIWKKRGQQ